MAGCPAQRQEFGNAPGQAEDRQGPVQHAKLVYCSLVSSGQLNPMRALPIGLCTVLVCVSACADTL